MKRSEVVEFVNEVAAEALAQGPMPPESWWPELMVRFSDEFMGRRRPQNREKVLRICVLMVRALLEPKERP